MTLDDYYIVGDREEIVQAVTDYTRGTGLFDVIAVQFEATDRHAIRWMRTYRYIEWKLPEAMLRLDTETILDVIDAAMGVIRGGDKRPLKPETVMTIRARLGWAMKIYDETGHPIPEEPAEEASE